MNKKPLIAVIDDDNDLRDALQELLHTNGFSSYTFNSGTDFFNASIDEYDLVLVDLRFPDENGLDIARKIKKTNHIPVIMFSGFSDDLDIILGLEIVADDYIKKPFNPRELVARIKANLRSYSKAVDVQKADQHIDKSFSTYESGKFTVNLTERKIFIDNNEELFLTNTEFKIFSFFIENPDRVITRSEILAFLGNDDEHFGERSIDVFVLRLRRKIESDPSKPVYIQARRGKGYIFTPK